MTLYNRLLTLICVLVMTCLPLGASGPKRELRGVWLTTVWGIDWPSRSGVGETAARHQKEEMRKILDRCRRLNLTTVFFQVRSVGDAMYRSSLEPWSGFISGKRGENPGWDPLEFVVEECHARGLECYAWVNPFRWSSGTDYTTPQDKEFKRRGWLISHNKYTAFNPGLEAVREHVTNVCREIVENYDIDGMVFDDYFYPNRISESKDAPDYDIYINEAPWMSFGDWRRANVHKAIADISAMIRDTRPDLRFGISPAGVAGKHDTSAPKWGMEICDVKAADWQYREIYSDPLGLLYQGTIDFISPQIYWATTHPTAPFTRLSSWWNSAANFYDRHCYTSVTLERVENGDKRENCRDLIRQIESNRRSSIDGDLGFVIYSAKFLPVVERYLSEGPFARPSIPPVRRGFESDHLQGPERLRLKGSKLEWSPVKRKSNEVIRYTVYEVPRKVSYEDALDPKGDGLRGEYLLGVTYDPEITLDGAPDGFRYAVCVLDGNSTESAPAWCE